MNRCYYRLLIATVLTLTLTFIYFQYSLLLHTHWDSFTSIQSKDHGNITLNESIFSNSSRTEDTTIANQDSWPRICLLMTFPNSGTSYTLSAVGRRTKYAVGTNYIVDINHTQFPFSIYTSGFIPTRSILATGSISIHSFTRYEILCFDQDSLYQFLLQMRSIWI